MDGARSRPRLPCDMPELAPGHPRGPTRTASPNRHQVSSRRSSRIRAELGYAEVVDERTALERTIAWERANPLVEVDLDYDAEDAALAALEA